MCVGGGVESERGTRHGTAHQEFVQFWSKNPATYANDTRSFLPPRDCALGFCLRCAALKTEETVKARRGRARTEREGGTASNLSKLLDALTQSSLGTEKKGFCCETDTQNKNHRLHRFSTPFLK